MLVKFIHQKNIFKYIIRMALAYVNESSPIKFIMNAYRKRMYCFWVYLY